jgi:hypothetical protein
MRFVGIGVPFRISTIGLGDNHRLQIPLLLLPGADGWIALPGKRGLKPESGGQLLEVKHLGLLFSLSQAVKDSRHQILQTDCP